MKGLLIGLGVGLGLTATYVVKKINDDRQECVVKSDENTKVVTVETFKQAAKRKVNEILQWISKNTEKVESFVRVASIITTAVSVITAGMELYSSTKRLVKDPDEELLREVDEIRMRLVYLTPDVEVEHF